MRRPFRPAALAGVAAVLLAGTAAARQDDAKKAADPAPKFDPKDVLVGPPPELAALRAAVEAAAKKGENVDDVRAKLEALEKALAGKAWVRPKAAPDAAPDAPPQPGIQPPPVIVRPQPLPRREVLVPPQIQLPGGRPPAAVPPQPDVDALIRGLGLVQPDLDAVVRGQALLLEAAQLMVDDPVGNRERVEQLRRQAQDLMGRALGGGRNPGGLMVLPGFDGVRPAGGNGRLGVRVERVPPQVADQIDLPARRGVLASEVVPGTPADRAGVKANDVIVEFAGQPVTDDPTDFVAQVQRARGGEKLDMTVLRKGKREVVRGIELPADVGRAVPRVAPPVRAEALPALPLQPPDAPRPDAGAGRKSAVNVQVTDTGITVTGEEDGLKVKVEGTAGPDGLVPTRIEVTDGDRTTAAESVDRLPQQYQARVRALLGRVRVGGGR